MRPIRHISTPYFIPFLITVLACLGGIQSGFGQDRGVDITLTSDTTLLDTNSIIPESFLLVGLDSADFTIDFAKATLVLAPSIRLPKDVQVSFRTFPFNFTKPYRHKDEAMIVARQRVYNPFRSTANERGNNDILTLGDIEKRGSISRGITVGSAQNLSVNSSLNLQLSGRLNERFGIVAAIADQNIPIQPDGNTQQLQDFDQVYIQVFDDHNRLTAGDFQVVRNDQSYFMQFNKRLQGARIESELVNIGGDSNKVLQVDASGAVSRGKFARQTIQGVEGNQGPYRLLGADGEPFIIVLSGTERVYLDGRLLIRGQENDYVINYNTSEITFTAKVPITKDRRVVAEYQYSDRNYARSMIYGGANYQSDRWDFDLAIYSEQDAKNQPLQQALTDGQKDVLRNAGDDLNGAVASSVDSVAFSENQLLYDQIDTSYFDSTSGSTTSFSKVLVYSTDPDKAHYQAVFSNVGEGNGDYIFKEQLAFGRIYEWIAPIDGQSQGTHAPIIKLVTPKQRQMISARAQYKISEQITASIEWAGSGSDDNTFSLADENDDLGMGARVVVDGEQRIRGSWHAIASVDYEYLHRNFQQIERFRGVEFDRDWNIRGLDVPSDQNVLGAKAGFRKSKELKAIYGIRSFNAGSSFEGLQNSLDLTSDMKHLKGSYGASLIKQQGDLIQSEYFQHNTDLRIPIWKIQLGFKDDLEDNRRFDPSTDTLSELAYKWWEWEASISNPDSAVNKYKASYAERTDWLKKDESLGRATFARIYGFEMGLNKMKNARLGFRLNYRTLDILNDDITNLKPENTLLSRTEYQFRLFQGAITSTSFYEIGSGLENRREFVYIETTPGQGTHIHIDYNDNGEKDLDEFELAVQADQVASANYLKVFVPTNDYIKVFRNQFSQSLFIRPAAVWRGEQGLRKAISYFSNQFSFVSDRKTLALPLLEQFNPFLLNLADTVLQSTNANFRNIFYFNQSHPIFGADVTYQRLESRNLLTSGFESRENEKTSVGFRWNFTSILSLEGRGEQGVKSSSSDASILNSRNYSINYIQAEPKLVIQPGVLWRLSLVFNYKEQTNTMMVEGATTGGERSFARRSGMEFTLSSPDKGSLLLTGNVIQINYAGEAGSPVGFEMLDGLQPGLNATWGVSYQRTLANNLQINLTYNGRQSPGLNMIHTGGVEARAFF
ncbi:MAG: hypothetical protein HQ500_00360 [Flavobacteriales bacterium]|nr:hypothetical protein [Flavobacteriales bacterium]